MNWIHNSRLLAAFLSVAVMVLSPVAQGKTAADQQQAQMKAFLKVTGFNDNKNRMTIGEFHRKFRLWYPQPLRGQLDQWSALHRYEKMPEVSSQLVKDKNGVEQLRMVFIKDKQTFTLTSGDGFGQIMSQKMTATDYYNTNALIKRLSTKDPYFKRIVKTTKPVDPRKVSIALTAKEWRSFTKKQRAQYLLQLRYLTMAAAKVFNEDGKERKTSSVEMDHAYALIASWIVGQEALAAREQIPKKGDSCIVAGYVTTYGENLSCGGMESGRKDWAAKVQTQFKQTFPNGKTCSGGAFPCNPLVYGFDGSGGTHCVTSTEIKYATRDCGVKSPLSGQDDKVNARRIVESWLKAQGRNQALEVNADGDLSPESRASIEKELQALDSYISEAEAHCDSEAGKKLQERREDQVSACEEIKKRRLALLAFTVAPAEEDCATTKPGSNWDAEQKACVCSGGCVDDGGTCKVPDEPINEGPVEEEKKTNIWPWVIGIGAAALVAGCIFWFCKSKDKKDPPVYVPPVDPPLPPVDPPPVDPPPPPPPPPPPVDPPVEGGTGTAPIDGGGVR